MKKDLTDITVVLDRSGSMAACKTDTENGLNHFIEEQKKEPGETNFTLVQFDTQYEFVHNGVPIKQVSTFSLQPRGMTALLDAVGRAISETGSRLAKMKEEDRPSLVVFAIITDGEENSSKEYTRTQIKEMTEHQTNVYKWKFTYLGANQDAFHEGAQLGIDKGAITNYGIKNTKRMFDVASNYVNVMRCAVSNDEEVPIAYSDEDRKAIA